MILLAGIVFFCIVLADLNDENRKFGLEVKLRYGNKAGQGARAPSKPNQRQAGLDTGLKIEGAWDEGGFVYYARAKGRFKLHSEMMTWYDARLKCYDEKAELASPETDLLLETMTTIMVSASIPPVTVFTGINDQYARGIFRSIRGMTMERMPLQWTPDTKRLGMLNCLSLHARGALAGEDCSAKKRFICYKRGVDMYDTMCGPYPDYIYSQTTHTCYKYYSSVAQWSNAYATCAREQAKLLVVNTKQDSEVPFEVFKLANDTVVHVGATWWRDDTYLTIDGLPLKSKKFEDKAPKSYYLPTTSSNHFKNKRLGCVMLQYEGLRSVNCTALYPFICEKIPDKF